ncbi:hypothetical protein M5D96_010774 [Drosophila gunungcola]|uniref:Uncharacterized protein n=1 Tax=Drosophila gunungcola TaxID=103775 RepID=A0A9P9YGD1_9MUSC|nr:hypothetical protein M5D96_010774 [Drosophila gunungcola]
MKGNTCSFNVEIPYCTCRHKVCEYLVNWRAGVFKTQGASGNPFAFLLLPTSALPQMMNK